MTHLNSRYALLLTLFLVVLPQWTRLPLWLDIVFVLSLLWRIPAIEQYLPLPNKFIKAGLVLASLAGIKYSYNTWFGPEAGTSFLIVCVALKLLETKNERDCYVLLTLSYFLLATQYLFSQALWTTLYTVFGVLCVTAAYVVFNQTTSIKHALKKSLILLSQALPLMLILFLFFPRLPPLWTFKLSEGTGKTGMSDNMSPGDLAKLSQSSELAFRVEFEDKNQIPPKSELYWRGLTFSSFDGKTWRPSQLPILADENAAWSGYVLPSWAETQIQITKDKPIHYKVILEPTDKTWLYSLSVAYSRTTAIGLSRDFRLVSQVPVFQRFTYDAMQYKAIALDANLPHWLRQDNLSLPSQGNPVARKMAQQWRQFYGSDVAYIQAVLSWFRKSPFYYTLEPPLLGDNRIDDFLFKTKRGFCEHYSSSFAFLLRAAGIPARIVVGYQGGEWSPNKDSWQVRQMDAHAWVEAWLPNKGWIMLDPTGAVAPQRIEQGMSAMAQNQEVWGNSTFSGLKYGNYKLFSQLRNMADYINYRWQKDIVGYDTENQEQLLLKLLGDRSVWKRIAIMFSALIVIASLLALWTILKGRKSFHPADKVIIRLSKKLTQRGLAREQGEGVMAYLQRLEQHQPHWQAVLQQLQTQYSVVRYQKPNHDAVVQALAQMQRLLRNWPNYQAQKTKEI
jgi:protein-glutamine gamma-glutamyltransferase